MLQELLTQSVDDTLTHIHLHLSMSHSREFATKLHRESDEDRRDEEIGRGIGEESRQDVGEACRKWGVA